MNHNKDKLKATQIRLPQSLYAAIEKQAKERFRSVNSQMVILLKIGLAGETGEASTLAAADKAIAEANAPKKP